MKNDPQAKKNELRIRNNMHGTLAKKFMDCMKQYQNAQQDYKDESKKKLTRQIKVVKPDATEADVDKVIAEGKGNTIFREVSGLMQDENCIGIIYFGVIKLRLTKGPAHSSVLDAHRDVTAFYEDVLKLERSMTELHQMFRDMAILVDMQGEMIDRIEYEVAAAGTYVEKGNKELESAIEHAKKARKRTCCIIITVIVLLAIVGGVGAAVVGSG